jgi:hypothetical protein
MPSKLPETVIRSYNWDLIQKEHNEGLAVRDIQSKFNITRNRIDTAIELGLFVKLKHKQIMTDELRNHLSAKRKEYLQNNPESHPWRKGNRNKSVPCEKFKEKLKEYNIEFVEEYIPLSNRSFSIDIAIPNKMIGIEINGQQHYDNTGKLKPYYQERHDLIQSQGWILYEIHYSLIWNDLLFTDIISKINNSNYKIEFDFDQYNIDKAKNSKPNVCPCCNKQISKYALNCRSCSISSNIENRKKIHITKEQLHKLIWDKPATIIAKEFNVSDNCINKLVKRYNLVKPSQTFWAKYHANKLEGFSCPLYS